MSLVKCPDCGHPVSDRAPACPECGCPVAALATETSNRHCRLLQTLSIVAVIVGIVCFVGGTDVAIWGGTARAVIPHGRIIGIGISVAGVIRLLRALAGGVRSL